MATVKTTKNDADVGAFLATADEKKRADAEVLRSMMEDITKEPAAMWGTSIVGFGTRTYTYDSGRSGTWFLVGFSPRKRNLTLYIMNGFDTYDSLLTKLGKHKTGKACLYINKLADVDLAVLRALIEASVAHMKTR